MVVPALLGVVVGHLVAFDGIFFIADLVSFLCLHLAGWWRRVAVLWCVGGGLHFVVLWLLGGWCVGGGCTLDVGCVEETLV